MTTFLKDQAHRERIEKGEPHFSEMELEERIVAYRMDGPGSGGHSDAAGADAYELLDLAQEELTSLREQLRRALSLSRPDSEIA